MLDESNPWRTNEYEIMVSVVVCGLLIGLTVVCSFSTFEGTGTSLMHCCRELVSFRATTSRNEMMGSFVHSCKVLDVSIVTLGSLYILGS